MDRLSDKNTVLILDGDSIFIKDKTTENHFTNLIQNIMQKKRGYRLNVTGLEI